MTNEGNISHIVRDKRAITSLLLTRKISAFNIYEGIKTQQYI